MGRSLPDDFLAKVDAAARQAERTKQTARFQEQLYAPGPTSHETRRRRELLEIAARLGPRADEKLSSYSALVNIRFKPRRFWRSAGGVAGHDLLACGWSVAHNIKSAAGAAPSYGSAGDAGSSFTKAVLLTTEGRLVVYSTNSNLRASRDLSRRMAGSPTSSASSTARS